MPRPAGRKVSPLQPVAGAHGAVAAARTVERSAPAERRHQPQRGGENTSETREGGLRQRLTFWQKQLNQVSGSIVLQFGRKGLSRDVLRDWLSRLEDVAADMKNMLGN